MVQRLRHTLPIAVTVASTFAGGADATVSRSPPALSVGDVTVAEPDAGTAATVLTVRLSHATPKRVRVRFTTQDASATAGSDYVAKHGTLIFKPRQRAAQITIQILGGTAPEDDEVFYVLLSGARNARLARSDAKVTIPYNHLPPPFTARAILTTVATDTARGLMVITCDPAAASLSYTVTVTGLPHDPYELHIHPDEGQPGGHILNLTPPHANGSSNGTTDARRSLLIGIYERPEKYFAAVHEDPTYPAYTLTGAFGRP